MKKWWLSAATSVIVCAHSAFAQAASEDAQTLGANCAFYFEPPLPNQIVRASVDELAGDLHRVRLEVNVGLRKVSGSGELLILCPAARVAEQLHGDVDRLASPAEIIEREDAAGRYYRHVAWQKPIEGPNWTGRVAYSDAISGDGQKARVDYLLLCHSTVPAPCVEYTGSPGRGLSPAGIESVLSLMRALRFRAP